jgi:hypothetical protein
MNATRMNRKVLPLLLFIASLGLATESLADTAVLLTTITNPSPVSQSSFGYAVAPFGGDRMLITAPSEGTYSGAAYLFASNGVLLQSFLNPSGLFEESFGASVARVGTDRVVIGAPYANADQSSGGAVYVFNTNGTLLRTLTNPVPESLGSFGMSVAPFGTDALLVAAYGQYSWKVTPGSVHLLDANWNLINTFTNPLPEMNGIFGGSLAVVGTDRVLIGAALNIINGVQSGVAYLFHTNGSLLKTFFDPTPGQFDYFGDSVAAIGSDRVIIGAPYNDTGATNAGAAFIFSANGTLLLTITNPTPSVAHFGSGVAVSAEHRLLISAISGLVYEYSTNGTLLATLADPNPPTNDFFGSPAWVARDRVLIGAFGSDIGGTDSGVAYLFGIVPARPSLRIGLTSTNTIVVSWPSPSTDWTLQQNTNGIATVNWSNITSGITDDGTTRTFAVPAPSGNRFFRLVNP